jgi:S-adenosylmethionine:tRNA ribosyltransferase-isomerase
MNIHDYRYTLPDERIAKYPLPQRDSAKLLVWRNGHISHRIFHELPSLLTGHETLFFNNTKVIPARLHFQKTTGGLIEIFLLQPLVPQLVELAMKATGTVDYACTIGHLRSWKDGTVLEKMLDRPGEPPIVLRAELLDRSQMHVRLSWSPAGLPFAQVVATAGAVPIPPYLNRAAEASDGQNYQTVYSKKEGAVAAPTAGLHFTPAVLGALAERGIRLEELTLHVSAGTFRPVKTENAIDHDMHHEQVVIRRPQVEALLTGRPVVAVGTTALRTLESLYWFGNRLLRDPDADFIIEKLQPYGPEPTVDTATALRAVADCFERRNLTELHGTTQIYIFPGYQFKVCDALLTNFHQPSSTLLLLIAAFTGGDAWKEIYDTALNQHYRFLSYGDSSLLFRG